MIVANEKENWKKWCKELSKNLHGRSKWRLEKLLEGIVFSQGRKTVTSWLRGINVTKGYQEYYCFLNKLGRKTGEIATILLWIIWYTLLCNEEKIVAAIDDTSTGRYGKKVEGAGLHHQQTSKPDGDCWVFGHVWVTLSIVLNHPLFGSVGLPVFSKLYIREVDIRHTREGYCKLFQTKLELALDLVEWFADFITSKGKTFWLVFDGGYSKANFIQELPKSCNAVGRLRRDAALRDLPPPRKPGQRGRSRIYGKNRISLAKRAGQKRGWKDACIKGKSLLYKSFCATYRHAKGEILVILISFDNQAWTPYFCSNPDANPIEVISVISDRWAIEENFHDLKQVFGAGQQQVRSIWSNIACWHLCLWAFVLAHLSTWFTPYERIVDRSSSPWDSRIRRPSISDRIRFLRREFLSVQFFDFNILPANMRKLSHAFQTLYRLVC